MRALENNPSWLGAVSYTHLVCVVQGFFEFTKIKVDESNVVTVSYTHLDVYKRQVLWCRLIICFFIAFCRLKSKDFGLLNYQYPTTVECSINHITRHWTKRLLDIGHFFFCKNCKKHTYSLHLLKDLFDSMTILFLFQMSFILGILGRNGS